MPSETSYRYLTRIAGIRSGHTIVAATRIGVHDVVGLIVNVIQSSAMLATFWFMFNILGLRGSAVRGDYMLYMMSGIFMYMTHVKTVRAVSKAATTPGRRKSLL